MLKSSAITIFLSVLFSFFIHTSENIAQTTSVVMEKLSESSVASLIQGLHSDNEGLKSSCAYWLGEYRITESVIPLQNLLNNDKSERVRISAALALYKIGTPKSIFTVKQSIRFDESERVRRLCSIFYSVYLDQFKRNKNQIEEKGWLAGKN